MGVFGGYSGAMKIPEEKKELFVKSMSKLLNYGGMMSFELVKMYGCELGLLKPVEILPEGEVSFHYNYFEDDAWETAGFDAKSCRLWSNKIGGAEFNDVIMAAYMLYEVFDNETGMASIEGNIINSTEYIGWINNILKSSFSMKNRFKLWENAEKYAFLQIERKEENPFSQKVFSSLIPSQLQYAVNETEYKDLMYILEGTTNLLSEKKNLKEGTYPADILKCRNLVEKYIQENRQNAIENLWVLLKKDYNLRKEESDVRLKEIAEMSLFIPARVFVYLVAELNEKIEFWKIWKELKDVVYHDEQMKKYSSDKPEQWRKEEQEKPIAPVPTSVFLRQDGFFTFFNNPEELPDTPDYYISDDDRLYWWDGSDEVRISEDTDIWLKELAKQHKEIIETEKCEEVSKDFHRFFMLTLFEIEEYYERICPFQTMYYEFLQNGSKKEYIAAVVLLKKLADSEKYRKKGEIIKYARSWFLSSKNVTHNYARIHLKRYLSVMANKKLREKYFNF